MKKKLLRLQWSTKKLSVITVFVLILSAASSLMGREWKQFETAHFIIIYYDGTEQTARKAAVIAEDIYGPITRVYGFQPSSKTRLIFKDTEDYSNGGAYYFDNKIEIWSENLDFVLRGTHYWLRDVITHEFTHIISIQKSLKMGRHIPGVYFQFFNYEKEKRRDVVRGFPNLLVSYPLMTTSLPVWFAEGVAQYQSNEKRFDYRDAQREMILRDRILDDKLLSLMEMSTFGKNSVGNESSYNQGFSFVKFLADTYGEDKLKELTHLASGKTHWTFESILLKAFGKPADSLYAEWKTFLQEKYTRQMNRISTNMNEGEVVWDQGFANLYPVFSPVGDKIAFVSNKQAPSFGNNELLVMDMASPGSVQMIAKHITSSLSWSHDGRFLAYISRSTSKGYSEPYNDLYIYDFEKRKSVRVTKNMRFRHPAFSPVDYHIVGVVGHDGSTNLVEINIDPQYLYSQKFNTSNKFGLDVHNYTIQPFDSLKNTSDRHLFHIKMRDWKYITKKYNGTQFFKPSWSPDGKYVWVDMSTEYTRNIVKVNPADGNVSYEIKGKCDYRDPAFDAEGNYLYFSSDSSGIFNIYRRNMMSGQIEALTNGVGGAFWPTVAPNGDLVYSYYRHQGFHIYALRNYHAVNFADIEAVPGYRDSILHITPDQPMDSIPPTIPVKPTPSNLFFFPRILLDYGTFKPGFYIFSNELLDRLNFIASVDINSKKDLFVYAGFNYKLFKNIVSFEYYNQLTNLQEPAEYPEYNAKVDLDVHFNLMELVASYGSDVLFEEASDYMAWKLDYRYSNYRAKIEQPFIKDPSGGNNHLPYFIFRYTYLKGHALELKLSRKHIQSSLTQAINPQNGYFAGVKIGAHFQQFLKGFNSSAPLQFEVFQDYNYLSGESEIELYKANPIKKSHTFDFRVQAGIISAPVDSFFHYFAGGLLGLKGYPFYSLEGRKMIIGSLYYRFPIKTNINKKLGLFYFKHIYAAPYYQIGDAWDKKMHDINRLPQNIGLQIRASLISQYFMPLRIFYEAAYPLNTVTNKQIEYTQQVRHYVGVLFNFDFRLNSNQGHPGRLR